MINKSNISLTSLISQMYDASAPLDAFRVIDQISCQIKFTKAEFETALDSLAEALAEGKVRKALAITRAMLLKSPDKTVSRIRKKGIFRCSKYDYRERSSRAICSDMLQNATIYGLTQTHLDYLQSVDALLSLGPNLQSERASIIKRLRDKQNFVIKTLLSTIETFFTHGLPGNKSLGNDSLEAYIDVEMAEAFSYLLQLFQSCVGLKSIHFGLADENCLEKKYYENLLIDAAKICAFHAAEILIDAFPYRAMFNGKVILIEAIDPAIEKSIRIGYAQFGIQRNFRHWDMRRKESSVQPVPMSMVHFAKEYFDHAGEELVELVQYPITRYIMKLPCVQELFEPFTGNYLFLEDMLMLETLGTEDYISAEAVMELPVIGDILVIDILKVQRFILFMHKCFNEAFDRHPIEDNKAKIQLHSCLVVFREDELLELLSQLLPEDKVKNMLILLTCNPALTKYIDLLYMPILCAEGWYMFSPALLVSSNLVRNLLCHNSQRLTLRDKKDPDPMQDELAFALKNTGFLVDTEIKRSVQGEQLEIDILAYRDGYLFIFECKNAYHPCNVYELRNSYEHITHAAEQLEKRKLWLLDLSKQQTLFKSLGWCVTPTKRLMTCIAVGNSVFNGYECEGHPARQILGLLNILRSGELIDDKERYRIWHGLSFSVNDLIEYLQGKIIFDDFWQALRPECHEFKFGSKILGFSSYSLDVDKLVRIIKTRYPIVKKTTTDMSYD